MWLLNYYNYTIKSGIFQCFYRFFRYFVFPFVKVFCAVCYMRKLSYKPYPYYLKIFFIIALIIACSSILLSNYDNFLSNFTDNKIIVSVGIIIAVIVAVMGFVNFCNAHKKNHGRTFSEQVKLDVRYSPIGSALIVIGIVFAMAGFVLSVDIASLTSNLNLMLSLLNSGFFVAALGLLKNAKDMKNINPAKTNKYHSSYAVVILIAYLGIYIFHGYISGNWNPLPLFTDPIQFIKDCLPSI